jgi:hypothetical protein
MRLLRRLDASPALVVACLALAIALSSTAFAATVLVPKNSVGSAPALNGSLQKADLSSKAVAALHDARGARGPAGPTGASGARSESHPAA